MNAILSFFGTILTFFYSFCHNYALALLLFAILFKILLFPLGIRQQKNAVKQAKFRPKEMAIRRKYAGRDDPESKQKMQQEIMALYQQEGYNPASGCLPTFIQLPIIMLMYQVIRYPLTYICKLDAALCERLAVVARTLLGKDPGTNIDHISIIQQVTANPDAFSEAISGTNFSSVGALIDKLPNFKIFGLDLGLTPGFQKPWALLILPVLVFAAQYFSMKLTRKFSYQPQMDDNTARSMKIMDITMPLMSVWFSFMMPGVIGVYWIYQSLLGVLQQFILSKMFKIPVVTEEEVREAQKQMKQARRNGQNPSAEALSQRNATRSRGKSLHYIDNEDYQRLYVEKQAKEEAEAEAEAETKADARFAAPLKKDDAPHHKKDAEVSESKDTEDHTDEDKGE